jgi:hypothetical protein
MAVIERPLEKNTVSFMTGREAAVAIALGVVLIVVTAFAIRMVEMASGRYVSDGIPPLPAFTALLLLTMTRPLLSNAFPHLAPSRAQILLVYIMLTIGTTLSGAYQIRAFLPHLVAMQYNALHGGDLGQYVHYFPTWFAPTNSKVITSYYEGASGVIPWRAWIVPLASWSVLITAIFVADLSMMMLVQRRWIHDEKLSFPLLVIPTMVTSTDWSAYGTPAARRGVFLLGIGAAVAFNGLNVAHVLLPWLPSPGFYFPFRNFFPDPPYSPFGTISIFYMLEVIGIGYFVPLDVSFSTWFFFLMNRAAAVVGLMFGNDQPGFPFTQDQAAGGYIAVGMLLIWGMRKSLGKSLLHVFRKNDVSSPFNDERKAWFGLAASVVVILGFCEFAGLSLWLSVPYFAIIGIFTLVYARIRAETGVPFGFVYPFGTPKSLLLNATTVNGAIGLGGVRSMVILSSLAWLSRHHFAEEQAAYQIDGIKLSSLSRIPRRSLVLALFVAFGVGLIAAYVVHLNAYYSLGSNSAAGGGGVGEFRSLIALQEYQGMDSLVHNPLQSQRIPELEGTAVGFVFVLLLSLARVRFIGLPFHPLGFLIATAYGDSSIGWFPMLVAWSIKACLIRYGGLFLYRRGMPFFLGLAIGHFLAAGVIWPTISVFLGPDARTAYQVYFGG